MVLVTLVLVIVVVKLFVLYTKWRQSYWQRRGVPCMEPDFFFGVVLKQFRGKALSELIMDGYSYAKAKGYKHYGSYLFLSPTYFPVDLDLIKEILQKDFNHFSSHGLYVNEEDDPLTGNLFNLENEKWRRLRVKLTPTFTSGKIKMMFATLLACSEGLEDVLKTCSKLRAPVYIQDVISRFTTDIIGSCGFGINCNSLMNPNSTFYYYGKTIFKPPYKFGGLRDLLFLILPRGLLKFFKMRQTHVSTEDFFMNLVKNTVEYREKNKVSRQDFLNLLLQLKNKGEGTDDENATNTEHALSMKEIAAQCFVFFGAGFESSSATITFTLLELAINQDIQNKLRQNIEATLKKHQELSYDAVMEMTYLDKVVHESLRKHPPFPAIPRECNKEYKVPGTDLIIKIGQRVIIPCQGIHRDPEYYPDPEKFDPERFSAENKAKRPALAFIPFGEGPRICIGARFAMMVVKVGLIAIIRNFRVSLHKKTQLPIRYETRQFFNFMNDVKGGVWLEFTEVNKL